MVLRRRLPLITIAPVEEIARIVGGAQLGIALHPLADAPPQISGAGDAEWFELDRSSGYFRDLAKSGGIAIRFFPEEFGEAKLELALWAIAQVDLEELRAARDREADAVAAAKLAEREECRKLDAAGVRCPHCGGSGAEFKNDWRRAATPNWLCRRCGRSFRRDDLRPQA